MRAHLDPGRMHLANLVPVQEEPAIREQRPAEAEGVAKVANEPVGGRFIARGFHCLNERVNIVSARRLCHLSKLHQTTVDGHWIGVKNVLGQLESGQLSMHEQVHQLGMPECSVCPDEIRREEDRRADAMFPEDRKGNLVVVTPAVVKGDRTHRFLVLSVWCWVEKERQRDNIKVLFEELELVVEGVGGDNHTWLRVIQGPIPFFNDSMIGQDDTFTPLRPSL